jgi:hypothetical protein
LSGMMEERRGHCKTRHPARDVAFEHDPKV